MTDNDLRDRFQSSLARVHMSIPADAVLARGDQRRRRRRFARWAVAGGSALVALAVALIVLESVDSGPTSTQLTAFTITSGPAGTSTVTLHTKSSTRLDPDALQQALAQRGITAKVTVGSWCDTATEPTGLHQAVTVGHDPDGDPTLTIHPDSIGAGAELSIGYFTSRTVLALIQTDAPRTCATNPAQAASQGQGRHDAIVITNG